MNKDILTELIPQIKKILTILATSFFTYEDEVLSIILTGFECEIRLHLNSEQNVKSLRVFYLQYLPVSEIALLTFRSGKWLTYLHKLYEKALKIEDMEFQKNFAPLTSKEEESTLCAW